MDELKRAYVAGKHEAPPQIPETWDYRLPVSFAVPVIVSAVSERLTSRVIPVKGAPLHLNPGSYLVRVVDGEAEFERMEQVMAGEEGEKV